MKLKGLVSLLVVFTMLTMSLVCAAASYSTTVVYDTEKAGVKLVTVVTDAVEGNMYTYGVYGGASGVGANGSISSATDVGITADAGETNLLFIDQKTASSSTLTFTTPVGNVVGKKVVVGTNDSKNTAAGTFGFTADNDTLCYSVKVNEAEWTAANLASITLAVTGWGNYTIDSADDVIYLPVGNAVTITFTPNDGYTCANGGYELNGVDLGITGSDYVATPELSVSNGQVLTFTLPACVTEEETLYVSIGEPVVQDNAITYYVDNEISADTKIGIDVTVTNTATSESYTITDLDMVNADASANSTGLCGIQIIDESNTLFGFASKDGITYEISPYYYNGSVKTALTSTDAGQYYIAE